MKLGSTAVRRAVLSLDEQRGVALSVEEVKLTRVLEARYNLLQKTARFNLNGNTDNAIAEALALSVIHTKGQVLAERELVHVSGIGDMIPGTPDGAVVLSTGGMAATQVVRAGDSRGRNGLKRLVHTLLVKVYKSLCWLNSTGSLGESVCTFVIACWIPHRLSTKCVLALKEMLRRAGDIDGRFEVLLLVPPQGTWKKDIFPAKFGSRSVKTSADFADSAEDKEGLDLLLRKINAYRLPPGHQASFRETEDEDGLGFLGLLLGAD